MTWWPRCGIVAVVAAFDSVTDRDRLDFQLMMWSPVRWFHDRRRMADAVDWFLQHDYHVVSVDASWLIRAHMFRDRAAGLDIYLP